MLALALMVCDYFLVCCFTVWTLEMKRLSSSQRCGDHVEIDQQLYFQTAKLEPPQLQKLKAHLDRLRQLRTVESSLHTFDRAIAYFHVEQYLNGLLHEPNLVGFLNKMSASCSSSDPSLSAQAAVVGNLDLVPEGINFFETLPSGSTLASTVDHLKYCIDVLVYFEKKVTMDEKGSFGRVPHSFFRGELVWHNPSSKSNHGSSHGMVRKIKCYACGCLNSPMESNQFCKLCESCDVVLYLPPSSVSTNSNEWYSSVVRFRESLQKWISSCLQSLLRTKLLSNMPYLLMHIMYLPRIGTEERSWLLRFLQFPRAMVSTNGSIRQAWSEDLIDHYLAMVHLVFHPEKLRRMSMLVSSGPPVSSSAPSAMNGETEKAAAVSPEWVLLENPEFLDRCFLSDDDFVAVVNQFPNTFAFEQLFQCTLDTKKSFSRALTLVLELTQSLRAFQEFEKFPVRISQLLGELLVNASQVSISTASASMNGDSVYYPTLFDQLFLTALHGLLVADCNRVAWKGLSCFPFGSLSELAKWDVLALLLFNIHSVPSEAKSVSGWMKFVQRATSGSGEDGETPKRARETLYDLITSDTENAIYLLNAVAHLAASCGIDGERNELVSVAVHELFLAGYTVPSCQKALGENGERAAVPISTICLGHPWIISLLISLLFKYHECAATWIHVFETFPVNRWSPTPSDLLSIQEWLLLENTSAPRCALARFLLDHINWEYDISNKILFTSPYLHRRVALIVAEAYVLYKARRDRANDPASAIVVSGGGAPQKLEVAAITKSIRRALWLEDTFDFPHWCWKLVLKLRFYAPNTHEPFIELIDLSRDRSREALTLRRWFANASKLISPSCKKVPFYTSMESELAHLVVQSGKEQLAQDVAANYPVAGGSGAPIQEVMSDQHESEKTTINSTVAATAAQSTEPIVAYLICQITTFVFSDRIDRWEPILILLKKDLFHATIRVLENVFPVLAKLDGVKRGLGVQPSSSDKSEESSDEDADKLNQVALQQTAGIDLEMEICMAAIQTVSTSEMLELVGVLYDNSYINGEERNLIEEVLQKGYIGGWESTAKAKVMSKLRFVRECSRYLHPALLPALINESFPRTRNAGLTTSAIFHGALSWISSTLRGRGNSSDMLSPSSSSSATAALAMRRSSLAASGSSASLATSAALGMLAPSSEYSSSTKALCSLIEREFEYGSDSDTFKNAMMFWMKVMLQVPYWFENHEFRHLLDVLVRCSMASHFVSQTGQLQSSARVLLYELVASVQIAFQALCSQLKAKMDEPSQHDQNEVTLVVSFLPPADATTLSSIFGSAFDAAQHVGGCSFLAYWALLIETRQELPLFMTMGSLMLKYEPKTMKKVEKWKKSKGKLASEFALLGLNTTPSGTPSAPIYSKCFLYGHTSFDSLSQYKFYRWCEYCLEIPEHDEAQVLYWQVFFALYFACAGGTRIFGHYFLERNGSHKAKRVHMRKNLQAKLRKMVNYCSTQAQVVLTTTSVTGHSVSSESREKKYAHFVTLSQIYTAMDAWLEEQDPNVWIKEDEFVTLPRHFEVKRLQEVLRLSDALLAYTPGGDTFEWSELPLWTHMCGFEFTFRQNDLGPKNADSSAASVSGGARHHSSAPLVRKKSDLLDEEEFAFIEDASDLRRRHSSFGSSFGDFNKNIRPLPLLAEHCGPATLTMLPLVSMSVSEESCVVTPSIPLNKHGLKSVAVKFSENLSVLVALDAELMDHVAQLYSCKTRTVTQSIPCIEGSNCRQPASFRFEFMEWSIDKVLLDAAHTILAQCERCDMKSMLTNMTWTLMDHHQASEAPSTLQYAVDNFLKLDGDDFMLVLQILLIDQIVHTLDVELQRVRREEEAANAAASDGKVVEATEGDGSEETQDDQESKEDTPVAPQWDKVLDRLHEKGLEWFRLLTELDTKLSRMVPPLREVLWRSIKQLGASFVCVDERETYNLLQLMLEDPSRINLLSDCFYPAGAPSRFVEMFSKLMSASGSAKLSTEEKLVLLQRFDFREWLQPKKNPKAQLPSKFDRETVLCIVLADISAQFPAARSLSARPAGQTSGDRVAASSSSERNHSDEVLRFYSEIINLICSAYLEDHVEKVLHAVVGVHDDYRFHNSHATSASSDSSSAEGTNGVSLSSLPRPVDAKVWEAMVSIPLDTWQRVPYNQIEACVSFFSHHMTTLRWQTALSSSTASANDKTSQYPIVYWQKLGVLKYFLDLFTIFCRVAPEKQQWQLITTFFEPLLSTLYQPANTSESSSISSPWSDQDSFSTGTAVCSCFVAACTEYLRQKKLKLAAEKDIISSPTYVEQSGNENAKLTQIWSFYLNVLISHAPVHICKHLHQFLTRIAWEHWCLTLEIVQQMRELIQTEKQQLASPSSESSSYPFVSWMVRDILCRMTWKSTEEWLGIQGETICSLFLLDFAKLCVELVLDFPHFNPQRTNGQRNRMMSSSNNVLPPYFVNFVKQQSSFWSKWKMTTGDLEALLPFTLEAVQEPLHVETTSYRENNAATSIFPANPTAAVMQDGFTRIQLVLRLLGQVTTVHHSAMTKKEAFGRVDRYIRMLYAVFEINSVDGGNYDFHARPSSDPSAWLVVLHSASCTVFYEKLDEIVQLYRNIDSKDGEKEVVVEEDLTNTIVGVLRFCNLRIVESFFKDEQRSRYAATKGSSSPSSSVSLSWAKCGNVIFVEIDSLVRDFASSQKSLFDKKAKSRGGGGSAAAERSDDEDSSASGDTTSSSSNKFFPTEAVGNRLGRLLWSFLAFRGGELCCLSACGRAIASVHVMSQVSEKSIEKWIIEDRRGAWGDLVMRLKVPELSAEEFEGACLEQGNFMTLQVLFLQQMRKAPALTEAFSMGMLAKLLAWMDKMQLSSSSNKNSMTEMKVLFFAAEVTNFVCKTLADVLPQHLKKQMLRQACAILLKFGHARKQHGIMKAMGIGGSLRYNVEFHVACLTIGVFLRLQTRNSVPLRVDDRIALKVTRTSEKHVRGLEDLLKTKDCFQIGKRMDWMLEFLKNPTRSLADQDEFFVSLFSRLYPSHPWLLAKCTYE